MHRDTRYKWKHMKGENHILLLLWSNSLSTLFFCRHKPTGGSNLNSASYNLQGSSNSHLFSAGINLQEAPTSVSYNWHLSSYNLIGKLQLPHSIKRKYFLIYLRYHLCSVASLSAPLFLIFSASIFHTLHSLSSLSNLSMHIKVILFIEISLWLFVFHREFKMNNHDSLTSAFSFLCPAHSEEYSNLY